MVVLISYWDVDQNKHDGMDGGVSTPSGHVNLDDYYETSSFDLNEDCVTSNPSTPLDTSSYVVSDCEFLKADGSRRQRDKTTTSTTTRETQSVESPHEKVCNIRLVKGKFVSKWKRKQRDSNSPNKPLAASLDRFVDVIKYDTKVKIELARDQLAMVQQMQFQQVYLED